MRLLAPFITFTTWVTCYCSDIYTSTAQIQLLVDSERGLLTFLKNSFERKASHSDRYQSLVGEVSQDLATMSTALSVNHPLDAYIGIRRFARHRIKYLSAVEPNVLHSIFASVAKFGVIFPDIQTLRYARAAIIRLQMTYNISASSLTSSAWGNITTEDCIAFADWSVSHGLHQLHADWLRLGQTINPIQSGNLVDGSHVSEDSTACSYHSFSDCQRNEMNTLELNPPDEEFEQLCRKYQDPHQTAIQSSVCQYSTTRIPYRRWKTEILSKDPLVALYYDAISDTEAEHLKQLSTSLLERSATGNSPLSHKQHEARTSKVAWLWDNHTSIVERLSRRVSEITGLLTDFRDNRTLAEPLQVLNYGIGGQYVPHYDYFVDSEQLKYSTGFIKDSGDRLATFMFYLGDVDAGGATVFPVLGIGAQPIKYAAVFWYNYTPDGQPDPRTKHGGCPVLYGQKWVANKWIRQISAAITESCPRKKPVPPLYNT
ncbi:prolyl 4-hydroxylase subunit alpha-1-like [Gigantopelta aegis]|uniref:prolyl 4-hydroxylase subunit alpha-1-like n=1 Tax=Gigantopelta aegis TaxID=1735272 RepID=UPI001B8873C8|nr:prolyl 4-hydroxylase subunit alpha-1-like [Gigantopelta aegis]